MNFLKNFWFIIKSKSKPQLADAKTRRFIYKHNIQDEKLVQKLSTKKFPNGRQIRYIGKLLSQTEHWLLRFFWLLIIASVIFIGLNYFFNFTEKTPKQGGEYTEGLVGAPQYVNPIFASNSDVDQDISSLIFNGLLKYDQNQGLRNDLAEEYTLSEDQKIYTFKLRQDVYWHDGIKFTADDILFTFDVINDPQAHSPLYLYFAGITIEKIDDFTVRFILKEPFAPFLENLTVGILPKHLWSNVSVSNLQLSELNLKPIGTGPYKFKSFTKDSRTSQIKDYQLEVNNGFYDQVPYLEKIIFKFYQATELAIDALNNKKIQGLNYLPAESENLLINNRTLNLHLLNLPQYTALFFNQKNNTLLKDTKIRKIISHAIDKDKIINEVLRSQAQKIDGPILPGQLGYTEDYSKYPFNLDYANQTLTESGWVLADYIIATPESTAEETTDENTDTAIEEPAPVEPVEQYPFKVRKKNSNYLEFDLTTVDLPEYKKISETIQKDLQQIGVKINLKFISGNDINREIIKTRDYQILLYGEIIGYDPDPYAFWHSSQTTAPGLNLSLFADKKTDELLEAARKTSDPTTRAEKYVAFQKIIGEEVPAIFLYNPTYTYPQTKKIQGFNNHTIIIPSNRFNNISSWYIETKRKLF
jgi:peptide/nickel transport system substrate-binding protein